MVRISKSKGVLDKEYTVCLIHIDWTEVQQLPKQ